MQDRLPNLPPGERPPLIHIRAVPHKGQPGYVYLAEFLDGYYKIGLTTQPENRMRKLSSGTPLCLTLVHAVPVEDMTWAESYVHGMLASKRVKGEWFKLGDADVEWFCSLEGLSEASI